VRDLTADEVIVADQTYIDRTEQQKRFILHITYTPPTAFMRNRGVMVDTSAPHDLWNRQYMVRADLVAFGDYNLAAKDPIEFSLN